jgi:hypothetical protein
MSASAVHPDARPVRSALLRPVFLAAAIVLFGSAVGLSTAISALRLYTKHFPITVPHQCNSIPTRTASWEQVGRDDLMSESVLETLGTPNYVSRRYVERHPADAKNPQVVDVHMAYYTGQVDTVPHVPERCFVAGGASIAGPSVVLPIPLDRSAWGVDDQAGSEATAALGLRDATIHTARLGPDSAAPGNRVHLPRGVENLELRVSEFKQPGSDQPFYAGYFFIANGAVTSSAQNVRLLAFDLKSDYAFYMKVQFSATRIKGPEELARMAGSLLDEILPDIMLCCPDWPDVIRGDYPADNPRRKKSTPEHVGP